MRLTIAYSHFFDGAQVKVERGDGLDDECLVEFGDGATVIGLAQASDDGGFIIALPEYRTATGHLVASRRWHLTGSSEGVWRVRRIAG